jgi:hypothetical protein
MMEARAVLDRPINVPADDLRAQNALLRAECDRWLQQITDVTNERNDAYMKIARYMKVLRGEDERANLIVSCRVTEGEVGGGNILRSVGLALGIDPEER